MTTSIDSTFSSTTASLQQLWEDIDAAQGTSLWQLEVEKRNKLTIHQVFVVKLDETALKLQLA